MANKFTEKAAERLGGLVQRFRDGTIGRVCAYATFPKTELMNHAIALIVGLCVTASCFSAWFMAMGG